MKAITNTIATACLGAMIFGVSYTAYKFISQSVSVQQRIKKSNDDFDLTRCENNEGFHHKQYTGGGGLFGRSGFMAYICNNGVVLYDIEGYPPTYNDYSKQ